MKRPLENDCRSHARPASVIGLRAKATAIDVPSSISDVCSAASSSGRNGSWFVSAVQAPEYPARSSSAACSPAVSSPPMPPSTFMTCNLRDRGGRGPTLRRWRRALSFSCRVRLRVATRRPRGSASRARHPHVSSPARPPSWRSATHRRGRCRARAERRAHRRRRHRHRRCRSCPPGGRGSTARRRGSTRTHLVRPASPRCSCAPVAAPSCAAATDRSDPPSALSSASSDSLGTTMSTSPAKRSGAAIAGAGLSTTVAPAAFAAAAAATTTSAGSSSWSSTTAARPITAPSRSMSATVSSVVRLGHDDDRVLTRLLDHREGDPGADAGDQLHT